LKHNATDPPLPLLLLLLLHLHRCCTAAVHAHR
jgi:hypothetical protein